MKNQTKIDFEKIRNTLSKVRTICHFLPALSTIAWLLYLANPDTFGDSYFVVGMLLVGWAALLIARPLKTIKTFCKLTFGGLVGGFAIFPIPPFCILSAAIGMGIGCMLSFLLLLGVPVVFTIYCLRNDSKEGSVPKFLMKSRAPKVISVCPGTEDAF